MTTTLPQVALDFYWHYRVCSAHPCDLCDHLAARLAAAADAEIREEEGV